jgi:hypothetical protein
MLRDIIIFRQVNPKHCPFEGVGNENLDFERGQRLFGKGPFKTGPKKSLPPLKLKIFFAHPFKWAKFWVSPHKKFIPATFKQQVHW